MRRPEDVVRSFDPDPSVIIADAAGQLAHRASLDQSRRMVRRLYAVRPGVWCLVGNGLSNQTFIEGPGGLIAIDTGECIEEMESALREVRAHTSAPLVAALYSHFHYVGGTQAVFADAGGALPVYGHERIALNRQRTSAEIGPAYSSGLVHQFGLRLPATGPDGLVNVGLGAFFRNPDHAPYTEGFAPVSTALGDGETLKIAGLKVEVAHAPSDSDDSVTLWFPELSVCVQNLVWPTLFNVFAIRGEEYRNPQVLIPGIDHILALEPEHVIGTHGPPLSGRDDIQRRVTRYRDSIQFLWDQTVRGLNRGMTADQLAHSVVLPASFDEDYLTTEFYGVAEHHVRQIAAGVRGWFDGDAGKLFPMEPVARADRLVERLGGADAVRADVATARAANDLRWALEIANWLATRSQADTRDRKILADVLRDIAYRTSAANIRNWCLTRARDIDGSADLSRLREHRLRPQVLAAQSPRQTLHVLRVLLEPRRAEGIDHHVRFAFTDAPHAGLHVRNCVAVATDGAGAGSTLDISYADLVAVLSGKATLKGLMASGGATLAGDGETALAALASFDIPGLSDRTA